MSTKDSVFPGMRLGRYELLLPIAKGGMASVWAARQRGPHGFTKIVAIKLMLPELAGDARLEQMFLDEAVLAARIRHPSVCEVLDLGQHGDILYIVMEWIEGEALSVLLKALKQSGARVPMHLAMRVGIQTAAALHAAHELRDEDDRPLSLVHCDVSPQNILCTYGGGVKLVDFGVAQVVRRAGGEPAGGQLVGKVPYMSPEQVQGDAVDRRTDVFALGIVLYRMTTGTHPFLGAVAAATLDNIVSRRMPSPREEDPSFPKEVEQILARCLQKDPAQRYQTMVELGQALERVLVGMGTARDDLGAFVQRTMGDRGVERRAELRKAVRLADEDDACDVADTLVRSRPASHQPSRPDASPPLPLPSWPNASASWPSMNGAVSLECASPADVLRDRHRGPFFVATGAVVAAVLGAVMLLRSGEASTLATAPAAATLATAGMTAAIGPSPTGIPACSADRAAAAPSTSASSVAPLVVAPKLDGVVLRLPPPLPVRPPHALTPPRALTPAAPPSVSAPPPRRRPVPIALSAGVRGS